MRIIGSRREPPISFSASAVLLAEGARFTDEIHRPPTGNANGTNFRVPGVGGYSVTLHSSMP